METSTEQSLRFIPSRVDGLPGVSEIKVFPDRLELLSENRRVVVAFRDIVRKSLVADRDWFQPPPDRFFRFYTEPPITVFMPEEAVETTYAETMFRRVQDVIGAGQYGTFDLG